MTLETLKRIEAGLTAVERARLRVLLVSIDPMRDSVDALADLAAKRELDLARWSLARPNPGDVRRIAAVLGVQYRQLANKEFNHSTLLTLVSPEGHIVAKSDITRSVDPQFIAAIRDALSSE